MDVILKEQGFQQSGACTNEACAVEMGQLLGVDAMIIGSVGKVGQTYSVTVRMLDLQTGKIVHSASQYYKGEIDGLLTDALHSIAVKICAYGKPAGEAGQETQAKTGSVRKKSKRWLYITLGGVAVAGGVSAILLMSGSGGGGGPSAEEPQERPSFPPPPSGLLPKGGNR
jgi:hypothetical protein